MQHKIELRYFYGWDDAGWSEEVNGETRPLRFGNREEARQAIEEFFVDVKAAVVSNDIDIEEFREDYRIVDSND
jgi:hypothetical protein